MGSDAEIDIYKIRPDFVAAKKKGKDEFEIHYIIESKGEHLSGNPDSQYKRAVLELMTKQQLHDPLAMPPDLRRAHWVLDKAVDSAYGFGRGGPRTGLTDAERVAFLFELYHKYTSLLPDPAKLIQTRHARKKSVSRK